MDEEEILTEEYINSRIADVDYSLFGVTTTVCAIELDNGFVVIGKSACVDPDMYDAEIGERVAYEDAYQQLWPLFGFLVREQRTV